VSARFVHRTALLAALALLVAPAAAGAQDYDERSPSVPAPAQERPHGPFRTLVVSRTRPHALRSIQAAIDRARAGDRIRVARGTYRERVQIRGASKRWLRLVGDPRAPGRVVLDGAGRRDDGVLVDGADGVRIEGITVRRFAHDGVAVRDAARVTLTRLVATSNGGAGLRLARARGAQVRRSLAYLNAEAGITVRGGAAGVRPVRSFVREVTAWGNRAGLTVATAGALTVSRSRWFDNGAGIVAAGATGLVVRDNDVFYNDVTPASGVPFAADVPFAAPAGTGVLVTAAADAIVEDNRVAALPGVRRIQRWTPGQTYGPTTLRPQRS
jgi:hypothetical protein